MLSENENLVQAHIDDNEEAETQTFKVILHDLTLAPAEKSISPGKAAKRIDAALHAFVDRQIAQKSRGEENNYTPLPNPGGFIWELWDQVREYAFKIPYHDAAQERLIEMRRQLSALPQWSVQDGEGVTHTLWRNIDQLGHETLSEWLTKGFSKFTPAELDDPPPNDPGIRDRWRNYNAFAARISSDLGINLADMGQHTLDHALELERSKFGVPRPNMKKPEARTGHIPAAAEWVFHGANPLFEECRRGKFDREIIDRSPENSKNAKHYIQALERWTRWRDQFATVAQDPKIDETCRELARKAADYMQEFLPS